jgi:branched-chain amino acid transport system substrate-binding protein
MRGFLSGLPVALAIGLIGAGPASAQSAAKGDIVIGQTLPYSGPLSSFGTIGRVQQIYFDQINAEGGINGRKIRFLSLDDAYSPPKTVEHTRRLVENDEVTLMFGSLGTATNAAVHRYLNTRKVPQLFVLSGASKWADPKGYPWTMPGMVAYETEGVIYAKKILKDMPDAKIAIISQNDDFGRDYVAGFKRALGAKASAMIVAEASYEPSAPSISSQLVALKASGANVLYGVTVGKFAAQMIRGIAEIGWKPAMTFVPTSASSIAILEPAGLDNATGILSSSNQKDVNDPQWANEADVKAFFAFMKKHLPDGDLRNTNYPAGYMYASLLTHILRACGDDFSRENVMRQAASLRGVPIPLLLPGIVANTAADDYLPFQQVQLRRFDGKSWVGIGELINDD